MIDRELYLPTCWTEDPERMADAGVPDDIGFATKPALATGMLTRALRAGVPARWVAADEVYGGDPQLRAELEAQRVGYVLAIGCDRRIATAAGPIRADRLAAGLRSTPGIDSPPGLGRRVSVSMTGLGSPTTTAPTTLKTPTSTIRWTLSTGGCCSAVTAVPASWRSTAATPQTRCRCASWSGSPGGAGRSRSASRPARVWPGWTSIRFAAGPPGDVGRCWR